MAALARACEQTEQEWALAQQAVHQAPSRIFWSPRTLSPNFPPYPATLCVYTDTDCSRHPHAYNDNKVILLMSLLTYQGRLTMPAYVNAEGSINQFVKALTNEWSAHNMDANGLVPGYVNTDMNTALCATPSALYPAGCWALLPALLSSLLVRLVSTSVGHRLIHSI